jgi:hypothetical protein
LQKGEIGGECKDLHEEKNKKHSEPPKEGKQIAHKQR